MSYHTNTRVALQAAPNTLGVRLGRAAVRKGLSVSHISAEIGASRATVYSWFLGGRVSNAYHGPVERLLKSLTAK
jgi:hypothetical protein